MAVPARVCCPGRLVLAAAIGFGACLARPCSADPQWHAGIASGACAYDETGRPAQARWCSSLAGHLHFGRSGDPDLGLGPYLRATHVQDGGLSLASGVSVLLPVNPTYPFILSGGALLAARDPLAAGAEAWLFWGPSSYNFHGSYSMASGVLAGIQRRFGRQAATTLSLMLQLDLAWPSLPFIALYELLRGPPG